MKESVSIAHTFAGNYAASGAPSEGSNGTQKRLLSDEVAKRASDFLRQGRLHLHVPQGATPKVSGYLHASCTDRVQLSLEVEA